MGGSERKIGREKEIEIEIEREREREGEIETEREIERERERERESPKLSHTPTTETGQPCGGPGQMDQPCCDGGSCTQLLGGSNKVCTAPTCVGE